MTTTLSDNPEHLRPVPEFGERIELVGAACADLIFQRSGIDKDYATQCIGPRLSGVDVVYDYGGYFDEDDPGRLVTTAAFHNARRRIHLNPNQGQEAQASISSFDHEVIHAGFVYSNGQTYDGGRYDRNGIHVNTWRDGENFAEGMWLNEAMVETVRIGCDLGDASKVVTYTHAVNLLHSLMDEIPQLETELYRTVFFTGDSTAVYDLLSKFGGPDWRYALDDVFNAYYRTDENDAQRDTSFLRLVNEVVPSTLHSGIKRHHRLLNGSKQA